MNMKKTKHLTIRITESQYERLKLCMEQEKGTKSKLLREVLEYYLDKYCRVDNNDQDVL